jgi:hypothetical protein
MSKKILKSQQRIEEIKKELQTIGPMRPGKLSPQKRKNKDGKYYGSYWQISYTHEGKSHSHYVPEGLVPKIEEQTTEYRRFKALTEEWVKKEIEVCQFFLDEAKKRARD